jgi:hypothetical protein
MGEGGSVVPSSVDGAWNIWAVDADLRRNWFDNTHGR